MTYLGLAIVGYLVGSFPTGVVLSRRKYGIDVRDMGSGNIGATNITRVFGWYAGALTFVIDFLKGLLPCLALRQYYPEEPLYLTVTGTALVLGHCYSLYLKFNGGKGVATSLGCVTAVAPWAALVAGAVYVTLLYITKISAIGSLGGVVVAIVFLVLAKPPQAIFCLVLCISLIVVVRHHENIRRLLEGRKKKEK